MNVFMTHFGSLLEMVAAFWSLHMEQHAKLNVFPAYQLVSLLQCAFAAGVGVNSRGIRGVDGP